MSRRRGHSNEVVLNTDAAITVHGVSKKFRLYHRGPQGLKERLLSWVGGGRRTYEEFWALRDVSLVVKPGEMVGLIGANGSGKSTLLQVVAGIYYPDEGQVEVNGRLRALLELGTGFNPELSGRDNIFLNGALMGLPRAKLRERLDAIVEFAEIDRFIDMPLKTYSSGMQMRLAFSVAVHLDPEILVLDEVLAVGDDHFFRKCLRRVNTIRQAGAAVLFVSHELLTVEQMCDRVYLVEDGRIVAEGTASDVLSRYRTSIAAGEAKHVDVKRWGTGDIKIKRVAVSGPRGQPTNTFHTGDPLGIRIEFEAPSRVDRPVFGVAINRDDGTLVTGPNTKMSELVIESVEGEGSIAYVAERLPLIPGSYLVTAAVYDENLIEAYDHWEHCASFMVLEGGTKERFGLVALEASWRLSGNEMRIVGDELPG